MRKSVAPPRKGLAGLADHVAVVSRAMEEAGGKLEEAKEAVATTASAGFQVPCSGTWVEEGCGLVGLEVVGQLVEPAGAEGEKGDVLGDEVGVVVTVAPAVVGGVALVEEDERVKEVDAGVVQVEGVEERSGDVTGASSESAATGINHRSPLRLHHCSSNTPPAT